MPSSELDFAKLYDINKEYLKEHYREMMNVDDVPLPLFILENTVPDMENVLHEFMDNEDMDGLYHRYRNGHFSKPDENYFYESYRLFKLYLQKHPEFGDVVNFDLSKLNDL